MKRPVSLSVMILILIAPLLISGCDYSDEQLAENYSEGYEVGYNEGYDIDFEEVEFHCYYVKPQQRYGVDNLEEYLCRWQWAEGAYVANEFDCSEMSAYLEQKLENEGYHAIIVVGNTPGGDGRHSWLLVETSVGKHMPVEATTFSIVYWQDISFDNYFVYDYQFETIQDALEYQPDEFDWWEE